MKRCQRCLLPTSRPDLHFNARGVCSACTSFDKRKRIKWASRKTKLEILLESGRNSSGYDCVVPSSGGKDSHWQVLTLIEMGARPLLVTASTCHLSRIGRKNLDNLARFATTIEYSPNKVVRAKLNKLGQELVGDTSWPEHASIFTVPFRAACDFGIPLIFYGESPQEAYGGPVGTDKAKEMTLRWVSEFGGFLGLRPSDFVGQDGITARDMEDYTPPSADRVEIAGVHSYFLGQYLEWDSHRNARVAAEHGMEQVLPTNANWWKHENLDNAQTGLHDYGMLRKYGFGRACSQLSVDIRMGRITRDRALEILKDKESVYPGDYMGVSLRDIVGRIGMTEEGLRKSFDAFTNHSLFEEC